MSERVAQGQWDLAKKQREQLSITNTEDIRWEEIERTLRSDLPNWLLDKYLRLYGTSLAEFAPIGYNEAQVARYSDGQMSNQEP